MSGHISELWEVSWPRAGQSSLAPTGLPGTMRTAGVFLLLSLALFCFFSGEFFLSLKLKTSIYTGLGIARVSVHRISKPWQFWWQRPVLRWSRWLEWRRQDGSNGGNNFPLLSRYYVLGLSSGLWCIISEQRVHIRVPCRSKLGHPTIRKTARTCPQNWDSGPRSFRHHGWCLLHRSGLEKGQLF